MLARESDLYRNGSMPRKQVQIFACTCLYSPSQYLFFLLLAKKPARGENDLLSKWQMHLLQASFFKHLLYGAGSGRHVLAL
jgi:hypothetical protein